LTTFNDFTPAIEALDAGDEGSYILTQVVVNDAVELIDDVEDRASPGLQSLMMREKELLDLPSFGGLTMGQVWDAFVLKRPIDALFITIVLK
jgi:hypothetical protein